MSRLSLGATAIALAFLCGPPLSLGAPATITEGFSTAAPADPVSEAAVDSAHERKLALETDLATVLEVARRRNPDLQEARERVGAAGERVKAAGRLPDLELKQENWGLPLSSPLAFDRSQTVMVGARQAFPPPGTRAARRRSARAEEKALVAGERGRELDVATQVRRAFFDYYRADREYRLHLDQVSLASRTLDVARGNYRVGRATQQDVLRLVVALSSLHADLATIEQDRRSAGALLNTLMARAPDAPLGPAAETSPPEVDLEQASLRALLDGYLPDVAAAGHLAERSEAALEAARLAAKRPGFMVGADYWYMPTFETKHGYGTMVSINLPWLNPAHGDEVREARHALAADRAALESARNMARYRLEDALARYGAARETFSVIDRDLLAQSRQSFESAEADFRAGRESSLGLLEALRAYYEVQHQRARAIARLGQSFADIERAVGTDIERAVATGLEGATKGTEVPR